MSNYFNTYYSNYDGNKPITITHIITYLGFGSGSRCLKFLTPKKFLDLKNFEHLLISIQSNRVNPAPIFIRKLAIQSKFPYSRTFYTTADYLIF